MQKYGGEGSKKLLDAAQALKDGESLQHIIAKE